MRSLRARLWLLCTAVLALGLGGAVWLVWLIGSANLERDLDALARAKAGLAARLMTPPEPRLEPWVLGSLEVEETGALVQLFDPNGHFLGRSPPGAAAVVPLTDSGRESANLVSALRVETLRGADGREYRVATAARRERWQAPVQFYVQAALPLDAAHAPLRRMLAWLAGGGSALLILGSLGTWVLVGRWLRSLSMLEEAAREMDVQDLAHRRLFAPGDDPELASLAGAVNKLLDRLDARHATQQRLLADASHELRTPLTILIGEIDVVLRRERTAADYRAVLESGREEIARLSRMADNLLALARADAGEALGPRAPVDLHTLCGEICDRLGPRAEQAGVHLGLRAAPEPPLRVEADALALERVVSNVVENALAHTPAGESVEVAVGCDGADARIAVRDTGCGIAPEHLPHLFERFYRVDKARARETGGAGLGLAIVKSLVEAHGGRVAVESALGRGSMFSVWLPV